MADIIKRTGLQLGIVSGIVLIAISAYIYFVDLTQFNNVWIGLGTVFVLVLFGMTSALIARKKSGGYITFRDAFKAYFFTIVIARAMLCIFSIIITSFVLTAETKATLKKQMYEFEVALMKQTVVSEKDQQKNIKSITDYDPFTPKSIIGPAVLYLLRDCLIGFLVALVIRNKRSLI